MNVINTILVNKKAEEQYGLLGVNLVNELTDYMKVIDALEDHPIILPAPYHYNHNGMVISPRTTSANEDHIVSAIWGSDNRVLLVVEKILPRRHCNCQRERIVATETIKQLRASCTKIQQILPHLNVEILYLTDSVEFTATTHSGKPLAEEVEEMHEAFPTAEPQLLNEMDPSEGLIDIAWLNDVVATHAEDPSEAVSLYGHIFK